VNAWGWPPCQVVKQRGACRTRPSSTDVYDSLVLCNIRYVLLCDNLHCEQLLRDT
jgi:hypothetical protein